MAEHNPNPTGGTLPVLNNVAPASLGDIEAELRQFEEQERKRLGIVEEKLDHWTNPNPTRFTREQREHTTLLLGGLTVAQDYLLQAALSSIGYKVEILDCPDSEALTLGKEFGNRGQCNPTYFTVGNLVKRLTRLRDEDGLSSAEVVDRYVFLTAGACGPCRFGTYTTEYRKALRDAGFDGFRVMLFQQQGGLKQATGEAAGLELTPKFFVSILKAITAGDVLNAMGYRIRPYEVQPGSTDLALEHCKKIVHTALSERKSVLRALRKCRKILKAVEVDRLRAKPKVSIIGEFWAMTTEGDGNYKLQRFLEAEGAECDIQLVTAWILYNLWEHRHDTSRRMSLPEADEGRKGLADVDPIAKLRKLKFAKFALERWFYSFAWAVGLEGYKLPDMDQIATLSHAYYHNELRGGEGHMEVGKLIQTVQKKKAHMVLSVKPFGCMPSSGVSDGVQSLIQSRYPDAVFCPVETTGDGAVNVYSRVQMMLFKAKQSARNELKAALDEKGLSLNEARARIEGSRKLRHAVHHAAHRGTGTAANAVLEL